MISGEDFVTSGENAVSYRPVNFRGDVKRLCVKTLYHISSIWVFLHIQVSSDCIQIYASLMEISHIRFESFKARVHILSICFLLFCALLHR